MGPYQALYTISEAYQVSVDRILALNGSAGGLAPANRAETCHFRGEYHPQSHLEPHPAAHPRSGRQLLPHRPERRNALVDRWPVRGPACRLDGLEWTEQRLRHPPGTTTASSRDPACHADPNADPHPNSATAFSFPFYDATAANGVHACIIPAGGYRHRIHAWPWPGSRFRVDRDCDGRIVLVEIFAEMKGSG